MTAFQDRYSEEFSHCYGCGSKNEHGYQIKSYWDGSESVASYKPEAHQCSLPGFVYGGLVASLVDCHGTATAAAAATLNNNDKTADETLLRFVTASLNINFLKPMPIAATLELRGTVEILTEIKAVIAIRILADGDLSATGKVVAVQMPEAMRKLVSS